MGSTATDGMSSSASPEAFRPMSSGLRAIMAGACTVAAANVFYNQVLLSDFATTFHVSIDRAGLVATLTQVGYGLGLLFFIPLGDRMERRTLILVLTALSVVLLALTALSNSFWMLVVTQFLAGFVIVSTQLLIPFAVDLTPPLQRGHTIGTLMTGVLCGMLLARTAGGFIDAYWGWQAVYWIAAGATAATGLVLQRTLPHLRPKLTLSYFRLMHSLWSFLRDEPVVRNASLVSALSFAAFCAFWAVLSFLMKDRFGMGAAETGLFGLVGLVGALFAPFAGKLSDRRGPRFTLTIAMAVSVAAFVLMWFWVSITGLVIGVLALDLGVQSAQVAAQSEIMALRPDARNRLNTIYMVARYAGGALGSAVGTIAYAHSGWGGFCATCVAVLGVGTLVHLSFPIRQRRSMMVG